MRRWINCLVFLFFSLFSPGVFSQQAVYADAWLGKSANREVFCAVTANRIYAWVVSVDFFASASKSSKADVFIFSFDLQLLDHRKFDLGKMKVSRVDFDYTDSCYYAKISSSEEPVIQKIFRAQTGGRIEELTGAYLFREKPVNHENATPWFALRSQDSLLYTVSVKDHESVYDERAAVEFSALKTGERKITETDSSSFPVNHPSSENQLIIQILNIRNRKLKQVNYFSPDLRFRSPRVLINGSHFWVTSQVDKDPDRHSKNENSLFFVGLDTALQELPGGPKFVLINKQVRRNQETYHPEYIFSLKKKILILSTGKFYSLKYAYTYNSAGALIQSPAFDIAFAQQFVREQDLIPPQGGNREKAMIQLSRPKIHLEEKMGSVRLTLLEEEGNMSLDTILQNNQRNGFLEWDNFLSVTDSKGVHIFCTTKYRHHRMGIAYLHVSQEGRLEETELNVAVNSFYSLRQSQLIAPGVLLVPFTHRNKIGLMRLHFY